MYATGLLGVCATRAIAGDGPGMLYVSAGGISEESQNFIYGLVTYQKLGGFFFIPFHLELHQKTE